MASPYALAPCGTRSAYKRHLRRGEQPDPACAEANAEEVTEYRARTGRVKRTLPRTRLHTVRRAPRQRWSPPVVTTGPACAHEDVDPNLFFTVDEFSHPDLNSRQRSAINSARTYRAKRVCGGCPIKDQCLADNLDEEFGIYGGLTAGQRKGLVTLEDEALFFEGNVTS